MRFGGVGTYYDAECAFCRKWVGIINRALMLPASFAAPAQHNPQIWQEVTEHASWVVVDAAGEHHYGFDAMIALVSASPLLFFCAPLMRLSYISKVGERYYRYVARHRRWL